MKTTEQERDEWRRDECAELEDYLQQAKDDYELALSENEKLRAGLEKVRKSRDILRAIGAMGNDPVADQCHDVSVWLTEALDLAGVDHG